MMFSVQKQKYDITFPVTFDKNGGDSVSYESKEYTIGQKYEDLPTATHSTLYFSGWYDQTEGGNKVTVDDYAEWKTKKMYAQWKEIAYVTSNLVGMWDGENNNGEGSHSGSITTWKNLGSTGSTYDASRSVVNWGSNYAYFNGTSVPRFSMVSSGFLSNVLKGEWTVEVVFQRDSGWASNYPGLFGVHGSSMGLVFGQGSSDGNVSFGTYTPGITFWCPSIASEFTTSDVYTVVMAGSSSTGTGKIYKNGTLKNTVSTSSSNLTFTNSSTVYIGSAYNSGERNFYGKIYCIRCYDKMLTDEEIQQNYAFDSQRFS